MQGTIPKPSLFAEQQTLLWHRHCRTSDEICCQGCAGRPGPVTERRSLRVLLFDGSNQRHLADIRELFLDHVTKEQLEVLADVWRRVKTANADLDQTPMPSELTGRQTG